MAKKTARGAKGIVIAAQSAGGGAHAVREAARVGSGGGAIAARKAAHGGQRRGAGRPAKYGSITRPVVLTIPDTLVEALNNAVAAGVAASRSELVVQILQKSRIVMKFRT